jgi:hypothetical protein
MHRAGRPEALLRHTHCAFSLSILEYINVSNLSKDEARKLILSREQYYINLIEPPPGTRASPLRGEA